MIQLKALREESGWTQKKMSTLLQCNQSFISHIESGKAFLPETYEKLLEEKFGAETVNRFRDNTKGEKAGKLDNLLGVHDFTSSEYIRYQNQLLALLDEIKSRTGMEIADISERLYGKKRMIGTSLSSGKVARNMAKYIASRLDKLGLNRNEIPLPPLESPFSGTPYYRTVTALLNGERADEQIQLPGDQAEAFIQSPADILPSIHRKDLIGLTSTRPEDIIYGKTYLVVFQDLSHTLQYLSPGSSLDKYRLSNGNKTAFTEVERLDVLYMYKVNVVVQYL